MIIVMSSDAAAADIAEVVARIRAAGLAEHISRGTERTLIGAIGDERTLDPALFERMPGVERALRVVREYRLVGREIHPESSIVNIRGQAIGGRALTIIAGPPAVENDAQIAAAAQAVRAAGCQLLHGGAFLHSDNPYGFQGLGVDGLAKLGAAAAQAGLPSVSELADVRAIEAFLELDIDALAIGPRHMANTDLLREVGRLNKPVILKRGPAATLVEWLMAAETIAAGGNHRIVLCECGIKSLEPGYRALLDIGAIAALKAETHLPVIVEPAHATGKAWMTPSLAAAAIAAGADGLWLDVHPNPAEARSHAEQASTPAQLSTLIETLRPLAAVMNRSL
ncbi:3-deoxy-7-phosphoheptulonate synthase [Paludibacterium purpuratum]|uniref:3-deoxy-D-arabinoheptulosonate-7-phosphate synthase n=1 Tax=Paludibacterium purpuratum TaxID=1144873 RepID=A0A4V3DU95_9NEIS|nr:3-deoxy-7-phosphoheptulonate synthase [Paludibacterium purpuratum]TDR71652.1 3-deoxy-D-arabinoheptulosonate-7-phosphate synthase [Paludibacterium purpuratum]